MIALNHEFGKTITVTDKMRRFLSWRGMPLKADTKVIFIPPRQFMFPAFDTNRKNIQEIAMDELRSTFVEGKIQGRGGVRGFFKSLRAGKGIPGKTRVTGKKPRGGGRLGRIAKSLGK